MRIYDVPTGIDKENEILEKLKKRGEEFYNKYKDKKKQIGFFMYEKARQAKR